MAPQTAVVISRALIPRRAGRAFQCSWKSTPAQIQEAWPNQPQELLSIIRSNGSDGIRNRAVQLAIAGDQRDLAYQAVRTRGAVLPPMWTKAYIALTEEYFNDHSPAVDAAFQIVHRRSFPKTSQASAAFRQS
jgi:hypothetical protein